MKIDFHETEVTLSNGVVMPTVSFGTYPFTGHAMHSLLEKASELGYRSFDTAWMYKNEVEIGKVLKDLDIPRDKVFLTSKLHINNLYWPRYYYSIGGIKYKSVWRAYQESCKRLQVDYLDLFLLHWPFPGYRKMWMELVDIYKKGMVRAIGVSSFMPWHLKEIIESSSVIPMVNQIELNPYNSGVSICDYCLGEGIQVQAYSPLGGGVFTVELLSDPILSRLADVYDVSVPQVVLRWMLQRKIAVLPRTGKLEKMRQNISLWSFSLSESEMALIDGLNRDLYLEGDSRRVGTDGYYQKNRINL